MTDHRPTGPSSPTDPMADRVRDALTAHAASVLPRPADPGALAGAIEADARARRRRSGTLVALAAAAAVLVAVLIAVPGRPDDVDAVRTADDGGPAPTAGPTVTAPVTATTGAPPVTAPATTGPPTTLTTTVATTVAPPPTVVVPPLQGADTARKAGDRRGDVVAVMTDLRVGRNENFDRVVLEFRDGVVPAWTVEYVEPPIIQDGSGEELAVAGRAFLQIRLDGAQGHDPETAEPVYRGPGRVAGGSAEQITEVALSGEFEAIYTWNVGLRDRLPFRVQVLSAPARLVIDVAHTP